jgi:transposase
MPPCYFKPHVRRGKTDQADAEATGTAVTRRSMRLVPVTSAETQALVMAHEAREFLARQLTQVVPKADVRRVWRDDRPSARAARRRRVVAVAAAKDHEAGRVCPGEPHGAASSVPDVKRNLP